MFTRKPDSVWGSARFYLWLPLSFLSSLNTGMISCGILTKKQVIRVGTESSDLEYLNHVEELPVDISDHRDRSRNVDHIALFHQQFLRLGAYRFDHRVCQQLFPVESLNALVEVDTSCSNGEGPHRTSRRVGTRSGVGDRCLPGNPGISEQMYLSNQGFKDMCIFMQRASFDRAQ